MSNVLIGIHGLSNKPTDDVLTKGWEDAIREGLSKNEGIDDAPINFSSVYWADVMYPKPDSEPDLYKKAGEGAIMTYEESWLDSVKAGVFDWAGDVLDSMKNHFGMDATADTVLKHKLKDLSEYYKNEDVRNTLRDRLRNEILNHKNMRIMVLAHSMGTIIAYDVLRNIGKEHPRLIIDHLVTLGSPLGLPHVKYKVAQESPLVRTPSVVKRWSNFADKRDPVAMDAHLAGDYAPNDNGVLVKDDLVANDWGGIHHKSYGYLRTPEVSKAIRAFI